MIDYSSHSIGQALKKFYDPRRLGEHPLARARGVSKALNSSGSLDTPEHRGLALAMLIEQTIDAQLHSSDAVSLDWHILHDHVIEEKPLKVIAQDLHLSERSLSRYYFRACGTLAKALMELETEV